MVESWAQKSWSVRCLSVPRGRRRRFAAENPLQAPENSGGHVDNRDPKKHGAGKKPDRRADHAKYHNQAKRFSRTEIDVFEAVETPSANHQIADYDDHH